MVDFLKKEWKEDNLQEFDKTLYTVQDHAKEAYHRRSR